MLMKILRSGTDGSYYIADALVECGSREEVYQLLTDMVRRDKDQSAIAALGDLRDRPCSRCDSAMPVQPRSGFGDDLRVGENPRRQAVPELITDHQRHGGRWHVQSRKRLWVVLAI